MPEVRFRTTLYLHTNPFYHELSYRYQAVQHSLSSSGNRWGMADFGHWSSLVLCVNCETLKKGQDDFVPSLLIIVRLGSLLELVAVR